ncbi:proteasome assembly chaperone family protein [Thermococci archaeon]|nr:MAG: proteasome assembly chaperone family protein [Thermococci archaeon]
MERSIVWFHKRPELEEPILIEGLPGIGNVGKIAAEYLIDEIGAELFATVYSPYLPPQVLVREDGTVRLNDNRLYYWKSDKKGVKDLIILTGDFQGITSYGQYEMCGKILDVAEEFGTKMVFTLGGYQTLGSKAEPRVFAAATHQELVDLFLKHGAVRSEAGGQIVGASGLLLGLGALRGMKGISLLGETPGYVMDARAAKAVLEVLTGIIGLKINMDRIEKRAKETEREITEVERIQRAVTEQLRLGPKEEELGYIG